MSNTKLMNWAIVPALAATILLDCSDKQHDCNYLANCGPFPGADSGVSTGGSGGVGGAAGGTGGAPGCSPKCQSPTPVCVASLNKCVECSQSTDCPVPKPVCDTSTNLCVECTGDGNCSQPEPACNTATHQCVQCTKDAHCSGSTPFCDTSKNTCVQCKSNADCPSAAASLCSDGACSPCTQNADCSLISGKTICKATTSNTADAGATGTCVQCTPTNETPCNGNSCNPATNLCTTTPKSSIDVCHVCVADSECIDDSAASVHPSARCVAMNFNGAVHGNYCIQRLGTSTSCTKPYTVVFSAASLSGTPAEQYCGINQAATTCEAVLDLSATKACSLDSNCGQGQGGLCRTITGVGMVCTIACGSDANCLSQAPGNTCSSTVNGYCH